jgi:hypothetical protein
VQDLRTATKKKARAAVRKVRRMIDNSRAGRRRKPVEPPPPPPPIAIVDDFRYRRITGWVIASASQLPARVGLYVNDMEVASTWANLRSGHNTDRMVRGFTFGLADIWDYCKQEAGRSGDGSPERITSAHRKQGDLQASRSGRRVLP